MGREIRRVVPNWMPPRDERGRLQPMYDRDFETAAREWKDGLAEWERGERPEYYSGDASDDMEFWEYEGDPPDREYYRPKWGADEATWFQVYETVSEGTPVTPAFATREELIDYLAANGDFWDQSRRARGDSVMACGPWKRENAESFVNAGWAPSMIVVNTPGQAPDVRSPRDGMPETTHG